jgi:maltose alpha-D-glucosyltransferase/alpha-amylase
MLAALAERRRIKTSEGTIVFEPTEGLEATLRRPENAPVLWITAEQSNSSLIVDEAVILKIFRRITPGTHPEPEMNRYLTLNGFANAPAHLGEVARVTDEGEHNSVAVAQAFVRNQGDAWSWTLDQLNHALEDLSTRDKGGEGREDKFADYNAVAAAIGNRLGEMHAVLARQSVIRRLRPRQRPRTTSRLGWSGRPRCSMARLLRSGATPTGPMKRLRRAPSCCCRTSSR